MIENKIAKSELIQVDPFKEIQDFPLEFFDIAALFGEFPFLKEKVFRESLKHLQPKHSKNILALYCSADTILPKWAFLLCISHLNDLGVQSVILNKNNSLEEKWMAIRPFYNFAQFADKKVLVKGCSKFDDALFLSDFVRECTPITQSLMFGEACSSVPLHKKKRT